MVENQTKFYLYDRWFKYQNQTGDKLVYISIPKNPSSNIKIEINKKTKEITMIYLNGKKVIERIEISNITEPIIYLHYVQEVCENIEIDDNEYDNLSLELFSTINDGIDTRQYQMSFKKQNKRSEFTWKEPSLPLNEKLDMNEIEFESKKVSKFIDFASAFPLYLKKLKQIILLQTSQESKETIGTIKEIVIPQELEVYDRIYHLSNVTSNKIILKNMEEDIRNLEIKYDPFSLSLISISLKIKSPNNGKAIIRIAPNSLSGITARYCSRKKSIIRLGEKNIETVKIHSNMIFDHNNQKVETSILIFSGKQQIELLEHPLIKNNYTDGMGNLYIVGNSGHSIFYGIAGYAPGIFRSIENKIFKTKVLKPEEIKEK